MSTNSEFYKSLFSPAIATAFLLLIPLLAMQFTDDVTWSLMDFIVAGFLLFSTGSMYKLVTRKSGNLVYKTAVVIALASGLFLVWVNLAVGIIGSFTEEYPINLAYFGVIVIGFIGAVISRFRANGMAYTMFSMAGALALIAVAVLIYGGIKSDEFPGSSVMGFLGFHGFFAVLFVISALIFRRAEQEKLRSS